MTPKDIVETYQGILDELGKDGTLRADAGTVAAILTLAQVISQGQVVSALAVQTMPVFDCETGDRHL